MIPLLIITKSKKNLQRFLDKKNKEEQTDIFFITPQKNEYSIKQIKEINIDVHISCPTKRLYVFENFENSSPEAQNAFLKLLEESPENVRFILSVSNQYSLLPTVISRTKIVKLEKDADYSIDKNIFNFLKDLISKKKLDTNYFNKIIITSRNDVLEKIIQMCLFFRQRFLSDKLSPTILKELLKTYKLIKNNNLNHVLSFDHLLIFIVKKYSIKI